jgi:hypothetical protein
MFGLNKFAVLAALITAPALCSAQASDKGPSQWDGYISGAVGGVMNSNNAAAKELGPFAPQGNGFAGEARVSVAYTDKTGFGAQLDNVYSVANSQGGNGDIGFVNGLSVNTRASNVDTAVHGFYRTKDFLLGLYGQHTSYNLAIKSSENDSATIPLSSAYFLGADGQYYFDRATVYAQAGYQNFGSGINFGGGNQITTLEGLSASLNGRYFIQNNWKIEATYAYSGAQFSLNTLDINGTTNFASNSLAIGTEYRLDKSPVSFFGKYQYNASTLSSSALGNVLNGNPNLSSNALMVGVKFTFGTNTLLEQDRRGATLNPVNSRVPALLGILGFGG